MIRLLILLTHIPGMAWAGGDETTPRGRDGDGSVFIEGELKQWHKITATIEGPFAHESDSAPNPFTDYRCQVRFTHESGAPDYEVPGYFAADGQAAETSAESGNRWRAHVTPDKPGRWHYVVSFTRGNLIALADEATQGFPVRGHGAEGSFGVDKSDKTGRDFRAHGRLQYVGGRYLRFAGSGEYFLKAGPDSPETLLAYADFDNTEAHKRRVPLKSWEPHVQDWRDGDPVWQSGKGKGLVGALNYLAGKGCNSFSFMPYNAGGDGDNVWPFTSRDDKLHYDCSKLDQWQIVFDHATSLGLHLHFKLQETEMDDQRKGNHANGEHAEERIPTALDGGSLGTQRKLYCRELIARYAHNLAMLWNIGEENTQSVEEQQAMIRYLQEQDPYDHNIVIHSFPNWQERVYTPLLGEGSLLTGASLQNSWSTAHRDTLKWIERSAAAGRPWVVCNDEQNPASDGVPPDAGYQGHDGFAEQNGKKYDQHDVRKLCLWGTLMAGGAGVEYYFGYRLPQNDLVCEDFRSRERAWDHCRIALQFFREHAVPVWEMSNHDRLVGNSQHDNTRYCLAKPNEWYLVYLPEGGDCDLDLKDAEGSFRVTWFNPREGGPLRDGATRQLRGNTMAALGLPPTDIHEDWLAVVRRAE